LVQILRPALVVVDVTMPRLDGLWPAGRFKRVLPATTVPNRIDDPSSDGARSTEAGADRFLAKQDLCDQLIPTMRQPLDRRATPHSPMPADAAEKTSEQELYDLVQFLLESRTGGSGLRFFGFGRGSASSLFKGPPWPNPKKRRPDPIK
jgi:DNA-binding response OmpR family regulator